MVLFYYKNQDLPILNFIRKPDAIISLSKEAKYKKNLKKSKNTSVDLYSFENQQRQSQYILKICQNCDTYFWAEMIERRTVP